MPSSVKALSDITPAWLTAILTQHGHLSAGQVLHVEQTLDPNHNATLRLTYAPGAQGDCPQRLFFKQSTRTSEARFYRKIAPLLTHPMAPFCYDAQYDDANSHILVAYVERTHFAGPEAVPMITLYAVERLFVAARLATAQQQHTRAATLFGLTDQVHSQVHYAIGGPMRSLADAALATVRAALEPSAFAEMFAAGRQMSLEEAFTTILAPGHVGGVHETMTSAGAIMRRRSSPYTSLQ